MNFKKKVLTTAALLLLSLSAFAETYYVSVKNASLKAKPSGMAKTVTNVEYGDAVTWIRTDGNWTLVSFNKKEGWISTNTITKRKVVSSSKVNTDAKEIALAGKGFAAGLDASGNNENYALVDFIEKNEVSSNENFSFKKNGGLKVEE